MNTARLDPQVIDIRAVSGGVEYTWPLTIREVTPDDISADTVQLSLGDDSAPGSWRTPNSDHASASPIDNPAGVLNQRTVQLLVGSAFTPAAGEYWLWSRITDLPEIAPRRHFRVSVLADV